MTKIQENKANTPEDFNEKWRQIHIITKNDLWKEGGYRSEWQFLNKCSGVAPRYGKPLARIAAFTDAWPYRDQREHPPRQLRAVAEFLEEEARVGASPGSIPLYTRSRGKLEHEPLESAKARKIHTNRRPLSKIPEGALRQDELVVLIHGLGRTRFSMSSPKKGMFSRDFLAVDVGYRSRSCTCEELAEQVWEKVKGYSGHFDQVHFLTHSLGGLLVRQMLKEGVVDNIGRVVMLAPPNHGSEVADRKWPLLPVIMGPVFKELKTRSGLGERLGPARAPTAVITGNKPQWPFSLCFTGPNDGKVSVASARLEGMEAFLVVEETHTRIVKSPLVHDATANYFKDGKLHTEELYAVNYRKAGKIVSHEENIEIDVGSFSPEDPD